MARCGGGKKLEEGEHEFDESKNLINISNEQECYTMPRFCDRVKVFAME